MSFFTKKETLLIFFFGPAVAVILISLYLNGLNESDNIDQGRSIVMFFLSFWSAGIVLVLTKGKTLNSKLLMILTVAVSSYLIQNRWIAEKFQLAPLAFRDWIRVFAIIIFILFAFHMLNRKKNNFFE